MAAFDSSWVVVIGSAEGSGCAAVTTVVDDVMILGSQAMVIRESIVDEIPVSMCPIEEGDLRLSVTPYLYWLRAIKVAP
jgi:hypothetical protein